MFLQTPTHTRCSRVDFSCSISLWQLLCLDFHSVFSSSIWLSPMGSPVFSGNETLHLFCEPNSYILCLPLIWILVSSLTSATIIMSQSSVHILSSVGRCVCIKPKRQGDIEASDVQWRIWTNSLLSDPSSAYLQSLYPPNMTQKVRPLFFISA